MLAIITKDAAETGITTTGQHHVYLRHIKPPSVWSSLLTITICCVYMAHHAVKYVDKQSVLGNPVDMSLLQHYLYCYFF